MLNPDHKTEITRIPEKVTIEHNLKVSLEIDLGVGVLFVVLLCSYYKELGGN